MTQTPAYTVIHTPEADRLADIRDVSVNKDLPREERIAEFVRQIRDPYHFKCGGFVVRASFSQGGGYPGRMPPRNPTLKIIDIFYFGG